MFIPVSVPRALAIALSFFVYPAFGANLIRLQPSSVVVHPGDSARFRIVPNQSGAAYQWYKNGTQIAGATDSVLFLSDVALTDAGTKFTCRVVIGALEELSQDANLGVVRHTSQLITLTGHLSNALDVPVGASGRSLVDIKVDLFTTIANGESVYSERFLVSEGRGVAVENGSFVVRLGEGLKESAAELQEVVGSNKNLYVQFRVGAGAAGEVLQPRLPFTSMPYSISGSGAGLKGVVDPIAGGLVAPVGTIYVNTRNNTTWIRTAKTWMQAD
jgi:hypothetical protein